MLNVAIHIIALLVYGDELPSTGLPAEQSPTLWW